MEVAHPVWMPRAIGAKNISLFQSEGLQKLTASLMQFDNGHIRPGGRDDDDMAPSGG